jgi:hypothetical protein
MFQRYTMHSYIQWIKISGPLSWNKSYLFTATCTDVYVLLFIKQYAVAT